MMSAEEFLEKTPEEQKCIAKLMHGITEAWGAPGMEADNIPDAYALIILGGMRDAELSDKQWGTPQCKAAAALRRRMLRRRS